MSNNTDWILYWGVLYPCLYILWFLIFFGSYKLIKGEIKGDESQINTNNEKSN